MSYRMVCVLGFAAATAPCLAAGGESCPTGDFASIAGHGATSDLRFAATFNATEKIGEASDYPHAQQLVEFATGPGDAKRLAIRGKATRKYVDADGRLVYIGFDKQAVELQELDPASGHFRKINRQGEAQHPTGYSTPVGTPRELSRPLGQLTTSELAAQGVRVGEEVEFHYPSGVHLKGRLQEVQAGADGRVLALKFEKGTCAITYGKHNLFRPAWGEFDLLAIDHVTDAHPLAAP